MAAAERRRLPAQHGHKAGIAGSRRVRTAEEELERARVARERRVEIDERFGVGAAADARWGAGAGVLFENTERKGWDMRVPPGHGGAARIAAECAKQGGPALKSAIPSETRPRVCSSSVSGLVKTSAGISFERTPKRVFCSSAKTSRRDAIETRW